MFLKKSPSSLGCFWNPYFSEALHARCLLLVARKPRFIYSYSWSFGFFRCLTTMIFHSSKMFAWFTFWTSLFFKVYVSGEHSKLNLNLSANESPLKGHPLTHQVRNLSSLHGWRGSFSISRYNHERKDWKVKFTIYSHAIKLQQSDKSCSKPYNFCGNLQLRYKKL